jgi:hypothetical protein
MIGTVMLRAGFELALAILTGAAACWGAVAMLVLYDWLAFDWPRVEAEATTTFPAFAPRPAVPPAGAQLGSVRRLVAPAVPAARTAKQQARLRA